jgi:hypothetical protein
MISFEITGNLTDHLFSMLRGLRDADPIKLALRAKQILIEENERGLKAATNADGTETADLRPSTIERGRGGFGPPRIPRFDASWPIARFEVAVARQGEHGFLVRAAWPTVPQVIVRSHQGGSKKRDGTILMVARPVAGIRPSTGAQLEEAAHEYGGDILRRMR